MMLWLPALTAGLGIVIEAYCLIASNSLQMSMVIILPIAIAVACFSGLAGEMAWIRAWSSLAIVNALAAAPWLFMGYSIQYDAQLAASHGNIAGPGGWGKVAILLLKVTGYSFLSVAAFFFLLAVWQYRRIKNRRLGLLHSVRDDNESL